MARTYLPAEARCRQLERLVRQNPGATVGQLAQAAGIAYFSASAYTRRLVRESRISAETAKLERNGNRGSVQKFYPPAALPLRKIA